MAEPTIICPKCKNEIKLTESLAAPLIESTRLDFEKRLAQKDLDVAGREKSIQEREAALSKEKGSLEIQVNQRVQQERGKIAVEEAKKAKLALSNDIEQKTKEVADLQEILKQKDAKLTEAQKTQADLLKGTSKNPVFRVFELESSPVIFDKLYFCRCQRDKLTLAQVSCGGYFVFWPTYTSCGVFRPNSFNRMICSVRARL